MKRPPPEIRFPCHTTQRIVVFGGHDSWAREIKPKLPDVRFVDRTVIPNAQLISTIGEVAFYLNISSSDTFNTIDTTDLITIQTSAAGTFTQEVDDSGDEVFSANNLRVVCKGLKKDSIWDGTVVFYFENNSGKAVSIYAENVSVKCN